MTPEEENQMQLEADRAWHQRMLEADRARQQPGTKQEPIGWGVFISALILCLIGDIIDALSWGTIGWFVGIFIDLILLLILGLSSAGRKQFKKWIGGLIGESIPVIAALPLRTVFLVWSFVSSRSSKLETLAKTVSKISPKK